MSEARTSRKEREKERKRTLILEAAERVFRRKGYQATTMDEVAEEAEFSKGTLYLYFHSKFALFAELSNETLGLVLSEFRAIAAKGLSGRESVRQMLQLWAKEMASNIRRFRLAISWVASEETPDFECPGACSHRDTMAQIVGTLAKAIERGQTDGTVQNSSDAMRLACQAWSGMVGALLFSSRVEQNGDRFPIAIEREPFMNSFVDLVIGGLSVEAPL